MIEFATEKDSESIVNLWQEAFGDSREWVLMYLAENIKNVLVYRENGVVMGMLSLLPVSYKEKNGFYVYGVATGKQHRSKGVSTKLLDYVKNLVLEKRVEFLVLVPRNQGLFEFYGARGFFAKYCVSTKIFSGDELKKMNRGACVSVADADEYYEVRKNHYDNLIEWNRDMLVSIKRFENGEFYVTDSGEGAFCYAYDGVLYVKELCGGYEIASAINEIYNMEEIRVTRECRNDAPSCMVYPDFSDDVFFNISID